MQVASRWLMMRMVHPLPLMVKESNRSGESSSNVAAVLTTVPAKLHATTEYVPSFIIWKFVIDKLVFVAPQTVPSQKSHA